jgi:hypothetical protein
MTLSSTERAALRAQWLAEIDAEIERRQAAALEAAGGDPRAQLLAKLAEMGKRMRAAPDYRPPTPEENEQAMAEIEARFAELGYGLNR